MVNISHSSKLMQFQCDSPRKRETSRCLPSPSAKQLCCDKLVQSLPTGLGVLLLNSSTEHEYRKRTPSAHAGAKQEYSNHVWKEAGHENCQPTNHQRVLYPGKDETVASLLITTLASVQFASKGRFEIIIIELALFSDNV